MTWTSYSLLSSLAGPSPLARSGHLSQHMRTHATMSDDVTIPRETAKDIALLGGESE